MSESEENIPKDSKDFNPCTYKDPATNVEYIWNNEKQQWISKDSSESQTTVNPDNNYQFDGKNYNYTDKESGITYIYDNEASAWIPKEQTESVETKEANDKKNDDDDEEEEEDEDVKRDKKIARQDMSKGYYGYEGDTHTYTDSSDGTVYFWDKEKNAWFPKIDDDFMARYQMSYGFVQHEVKEGEKEVKVEEIPKEKLEPNAVKRKAEPEPPKWFDIDERHNTNVYVSNLPLDITEQELVDVMQKCGLVMRDVNTGNMKVKLYMDAATNSPKGDALCTYIKKESVDLALNVLDGYEVKGKNIKVERARFTMKGDSYDPSLKPKKRKRKEKEKIKKMQEKLFDWRPDKFRGERSKSDCIVIAKNVFAPEIFDENLGLILEYQQDIREECSKCGNVKKVVIHDKHKDGVVQIWFKEVEAADACVQLLNGRWFGQRQITAETWDGKTKYKVEETKEEADARLKKWEQYLQTNKQKEESEKKENDETQIEENIKDEIDGYNTDGTRSSAGSGDETDEENKK